MKKIINKSLALLAVSGCIASAQAGAISFTTYLVNDGNPGAGAPYDRLDVPWSESLTFNQFNLPGQQLDSAKISYSLYLELSQTFRNTATRNDSVPKFFSLNNSLQAELSLGAATFFNFTASQLNTASVPKNQSTTFSPFTLAQSAFIILTGADLAPFIGSGTVALTSSANALTTPISLPANNFLVMTRSEGNSKAEIEYSYSAIPVISSVPEAGSSVAFLGLAFSGLICLSRKRLPSPAA